MKEPLKFIKEYNGFGFCYWPDRQGLKRQKQRGLMAEKACETGSKQMLVEDDVEQHPPGRAQMIDLA